jgi:hypothetical protein
MMDGDDLEAGGGIRRLEERGSRVEGFMPVSDVHVTGSEKVTE